MMNIEEILKFLPHRYPFILVDRVLELEPEKRIVAIKNVTINEPFFQGHFPEMKIMPGVLQIEAISQAGAILLFDSVKDTENKIAVLSKIDDTKFKRMVVPGDQLRLEVEWIWVRRNIIHMKGTATVDGEVATEGEVYAALVDKSPRK